MTGNPAGFSLVELLFAVSVATTMTAVAVPQAIQALDEHRTRGAAHYLAGRLGAARMAAITRGTFVGLRFEAAGGDYEFTGAVDGNGNGVRTIDVQRGEDPVIAPPDRLSWHFDGVAFGLLPNLPDADGQPVTSADGVRIGSGRILSMNPNGSSSGGTLYVRGRKSQYAVRVLGATGRVRMLRYDTARGRWVER